MSRRRTAALRLLALTTVAVMAAACAPSTDGADDDTTTEDSTTEDGAAEDSTTDDSAADDPTTLTVWSWRTEDQAVYDEIFASYTAQNPGVEVEFTAFKNTEYNTILPAGLAAEGGPDVMQLRAYGQLQGIVEAGNAMALDDAVPELADFPEAALDGARGQSDGKVYGVPFALQTLHIYYNQALFVEHGVDVPTTWEELIAAAETLEAAGVTPFATTGKDPWMLPIVHDVFAAPRYGGQDFTDAVLSGEKDFTDPDYVASIDLISELAPYFPDDVNGVAYTDSQVLFTNGQAAMFPGGAFELGFFQRQAPDLDIGVFSAPVPPGSPDGATPLVPGWTDGSWGVNPSSPNTEQAVELVRWMASPEFGQMFTDELEQISPIPGVEPSDPVLAEMQAAYLDNPTPYLLLVHFRYGEPLGTDLMGQGIQNMLLGRADGQQVAEELQRGIGQWYQPEG